MTTLMRYLGMVTGCWTLSLQAGQAQALPPESFFKDDGHRQVYSLNAQWAYLEEAVTERRDLAGATKSWETVDLPHSWNVWDAVDSEPGYRRSAGWYKKDIRIPSCSHAHRFILSFEGVNIVSEVFVNDARAGGHIGGYVGFDVDITPHIRQGALNTILVRVSNAYDPDVIPSQKSDFHIYGGLSRNVWLKVVPAIAVRKVKITTPVVSRAAADVRVEARITTAVAQTDMYELEAIILDRKGKVAGRKSVRQTMAVGENAVKFPVTTIKNPMLWSPSDPALYAVRVQVKQAGIVIDELTDRFGCRWFEFKDHGPFFLNGERLLLRGTHRHEDFAGYANALPDSLAHKDMRQIKDMGANFVRLAHYPQAPAVYRACDELGILVWDELPWCRGGIGGEVWKANTRRLLREQMEQNFNYACVMIQSLGNELSWLPDVPDGDRIDSLRVMIRELNGIAKEIQPSRLTATRKFTEGADLVDVVSPSIWAGWYSGNYRGFEKAITDARDRYPRLLHVEYGGDSHVGRHSENPVTGDATLVPDGFEENIKPQKIKNVAQNSDWSESYIVDLFDWSLHISERLDWLTGNAQWAFKDFATPLRPENPIPYINQKGLVDRAGNPKDAFFVFKSYWTTSPLFCYIESHTWPERSGPENLKREVNVFSNCPEVELFLNRVSQGKKARDTKQYPACGLHWQVTFIEGENVLTALGFKEGKQTAGDSIAVTYRYKKSDVPDHIQLTSEPMKNGNILITAIVVDKDENRVLDYSKRIYFSRDGSGKLLENYGTPGRSAIIEMANGKAQIEFQPDGRGRAVIEARNQDFKGEYLVVGE